ncbi:DUF2852 domain-containing protein [Paroceanicella profunda]|uniref:DUF2852 domain-containing protein n=1 Tax=Paroceanicella profunda TaxID=2579971 RepID=A0A5B8FYW1_9RHOB|nr:DUF2852 domain-containing protein [Paroceanicella profunda]QDL92854.1 DUF2852 domain-containing protein [Paroceanicella profunda]
MIDTLTNRLKDVETWLDARGRPAWIASMVLGFVVFWPLGLFLLAYMIWSKRMGCKSNRKAFWANRRTEHESTGNLAFDEYRAETLRRLEEEQTAFRGFMERLRRAKDQAEFERFMDDRRRGRDDSSDAEVVV